MRLVLDTNVIISAFINPEGTPSQILKMVLGRRAEICYNTIILSEYENVMRRPKFSGKIEHSIIHRFISLIKSIGIPYDPLPGITKSPRVFIPDESDRIFYDTARESGSILISGNAKHFPKEPFIMLPAVFFEQLN